MNVKHSYKQCYQWMLNIHTLNVISECFIFLHWMSSTILVNNSCREFHQWMSNIPTLNVTNEWQKILNVNFISEWQTFQPSMSSMNVKHSYTECQTFLHWMSPMNVAHSYPECRRWRWDICSCTSPEDEKRCGWRNLQTEPTYLDHIWYIKIINNCQQKSRFWNVKP